jgi:two-component system LytT family sensor kinase
VQRRNIELSKEKVEAELKLLKSQIHPHFLFNTLNNLYSLTLQKSDQAPEVILKLSEMLDYMLYECNGPIVSLEKELQFLQNYIALEKLRFGERLKVMFKQKGFFANRKIAPLLLFPFVENSIKHGAGSNNQDSWITIEAILDHKILLFSVENNVKDQLQKQNASGLGLVNVRKRLEMLYGDKQQLQIEQKEGKYSVRLALDLAAVPGEKIV